jgi:general secretion pathway protein I
MNAGSGGFTLLEVLLAFVVFALSFAVILEIISGSMRSTTRAKTYSEAALLAQSLVDMVGTDIPLEEGSMVGEAPGGYDWSLTISAYEPQFEQDMVLELAEVAGTVLYWVDLEVEWGNERRLQQAHFSTVRSTLAGIQN